MHLDNVAIKFMLFWYIVPLKLTIPSVAKDVLHLLGGLAHCSENGIRANVSVLPVVASINATETSRSSNDTFIVFLEEGVVNTRIAIKVVATV